MTDTAALATSIGALVADVGPLDNRRVRKRRVSFRRRYRLERWTGLGGPGFWTSTSPGAVFTLVAALAHVVDGGSLLVNGSSIGY